MSKTFINEIFDLPIPVKNDLPKVVGRFQRDPLDTGYNTRKVKNTKMYRIKLRYKYRLFYTIEKRSITFLTIRPRKENTYKDLPIPCQSKILAPPDLTNPTPTPKQETFPKSGNPVERSPWDSDTKKLPKYLTSQKLRKWKIPGEYWKGLMAAKTESELLNLKLPDRVFGRILDNLFPNSLKEIQDEPKYQLMKPEDLDRFLEGDIAEFLLELDPKQKRLVNSEMKGPILIKGGPGTGKSIIALYRVKKLVDSGHQPILFVTHSSALVTYSKQLLSQLLGQQPEWLGVEVTTVDNLVNYHYHSCYPHAPVAKTKQCLDCLEKAVEMMGGQISAKQQEKIDKVGLTYLLEEFLDVIEAWEIPDRETYLKHTRRGRKLPLQSKTRSLIWEIYCTWKRVMKQRGWIAWKQMCRMALDSIKIKTQKPYRAIIIDEAQDFSPVELRFILALTPSFDRVYLTADASQSIYQRGFNWNQIHGELKVSGHTSILNQNYRNTQQITVACADILAGTKAGDEDCLYPKPSPYLGNWPAIYLIDELDFQVEAIGQFFIDSAKKFRLPLHGGAILCPTEEMGREIADQMEELNWPVKFVSGNNIDLNEPQIQVLTLDTAKGLEFPFVAVVGLEENTLPHLENSLPEEEQQMVIDQERRLFYVGCTRAMRSLLVVGSQSSPSQFLDDLPPEHWRREQF